MTAYIVKTKTSEYMVDVEGRFWMRNDDGLERIWIFKSAVKPTTLPWDRNETAEAEWVNTEIVFGLQRHMGNLQRGSQCR